MKRIFFFIVLITSVFIIQSLITSIYNLWQKHDLITKAERDLARSKQENEKIKKALKEAKTTDFVEKEARDKLFLVKPGESKVVIDPVVLQALKAKKLPGVDKRSSLQQWWELFF